MKKVISFIIIKEFSRMLLIYSTSISIAKHNFDFGLAKRLTRAALGLNNLLTREQYLFRVRSASYVLHPVCVGPPRAISGGRGEVLRSAKVPAPSSPMDPRANVITAILQLLLYHSGCQGVKRATTTYSS